MVGRESPLRIRVAHAGNEPCNIEILLPDGSRIERELMPPRFETVVDYTPRSDGPQTLHWEGRFRFKGSLSVSGCEGRYSRDIEVKPDPQLARQRWDRFLAGLSPRERECIEFGTGLVPAFGGPPPGRQAAHPDDPIARSVTTACERFTRLPVREDVPCPVSATDGRQTRCADHFMLGSGRKARVLSPDEAMRAVAMGAKVSVVLREPEPVRMARLEAEKTAREKAAADEVARRKAEEDAQRRAEEDAVKKAEAEAEAARNAETARKAEIARLQRLRCIAGRCIDLGF